MSRSPSMVVVLWCTTVRPVVGDECEPESRVVGVFSSAARALERESQLTGIGRAEGKTYEFYHATETIGIVHWAEGFATLGG